MPTNNSVDSLALIQRAKDGQEGAREELLERYRPRLLERIRLMMGDPARRVASSDDFLHGVFVEVLIRLDDFEVRDERGFLRWATTIARNGIRESTRRRRERAFESLTASKTLAAATDHESPSPVSQADAQDQRFQLAEALEQIERRGRTTIELHDLEGLTFAQVAEQMGTSKTSARRAYHKALLDLGRLMSTAPG